MTVQKSQLQSKEFTSPKTFKANSQRNFFRVYVKTGTDLNVEYGDGGGLIPLPLTAYDEPRAVPISKIAITGTGTFVIVSNVFTEE